MRTSFKEKAQTWFFRFVQIQFFIALISFPILVAWGIPVSVFAPIGNLIFTPVLALFLLGTCFLFVFEIFHIPNQWLAYGLDQLVHAWLYVLKLGSKQWLTGFPLPYWPVMLIFIPLGAFALLHYRKNAHIFRSILCFAVLLMVSTFYLKNVETPHTLITKIPCNKGHVTLIKKNNAVTLIDPGFIGQRISMPSWIEYSLRPELIKKIGSTHIDHLFVLEPGKITFEAIELLCKKLTIKNVYLILWEGRLPWYEWRTFTHMSSELSKNHVSLHRIGSTKKTLSLFENHFITVAPLGKQIKKKDIAFNDLEITCQIDNQTVTIYSAKHKYVTYLRKRNICPITTK